MQQANVGRSTPLEVRMQALRDFWKRGWVGKVVLIGAGLCGMMMLCCVALVAIGTMLPSKPQSSAIVPTPTADRGGSSAQGAAVHLGAEPEATETPAPTNTAIPELPTAKPTRTPKPTETLIPTFTPEPTIETDAAGIEPVDGKCIYPYFIKISQNGLAHSTSSKSYSRTNPIHCYAHMQDATDAGYTEAAD
jgi:hypothetical protein